MTYDQGAIVVADDPFGAGGARPFLVISNDHHPFNSQECVSVVVTTTGRQRAIALEPEDFTAGSLPRQSYVSPWNPVTLKHHQIHKQPALVAMSVVEDVVDELNTYIETP